MSDSAISETAAIQAALAQDWKEAIRQNIALLKSDKTNISLLNRLGFAYLQSGQITQAKKTFLKVMRLDSYNQIAAKNLKKLGLVRQKDLLKVKRNQGTPLSFLEEPGKTKIVECVNTAPFAILSAVSPGEEVELKARNHVVEVRSGRHVYLGALPDDLSFRLIKFLAVGNTYQALVKSIGKNSLMVFLREMSRGKRFANQPSFATTALYVPFAHTESTHDGQEPDGESKDGEGEE
jgi:tetratricopeptide (TPR) repeat protein